jgi:hypothetical protein
MATRLGEKRPSVCWNVDGNKRKMLGSDVCFLQSVDILGTNETAIAGQRYSVCGRGRGRG